MNKTIRKLSSILLSAVMVVSMTTVAFAVDSEVTTTLSNTAEVGETINFTVTTVPDELQKGKSVLAVFDVEKDGTTADFAADFNLEYIDNGQWYNMPDGIFGPRNTGFPFSDKASDFRITFKNAGEYVANIVIKEFDSNTQQYGNTFASESVTITVTDPDQPDVTTNIGSLTNVKVGEAEEFTVTTTGKYDSSKMVYGDFSATVDGKSATIGTDFTLKYWNDEADEFQTMPESYFGPEGGFPFNAGGEGPTESKFEVTFITPGTYDVTVNIKEKEGDAVVCKTSAEVVVTEDGVEPEPIPDPDEDKPSRSNDDGDYYGVEKWDEVKRQIADADEGDTIKVSGTGLPYFPSSVARELKGKDITLEIRKNGVTYTVNGLEIGAVDKIWYEFENIEEQLLTAEPEEDKADEQKPQDGNTVKENPATGR
ncbi:MAG: hypothetical protein KH009_04195 [Clostridiales bacterium]|nr:hypothetical protein [Clostridiales bacterium]